MMYSLLGIFLVSFILTSEIGGLTLEERDAVIWASSKHENDTSIRKMRVNYEARVIADLKRRLSRKRKPFVQLEGIKSEYGVDPDVLDSWIAYWRDSYNFTEREAFFNQYDHFITNIQGLDIHFIQVKPSSKVRANCKVLPLLLLHGFPGSVREFYSALSIISNRCFNGIAFDIIVPSLPGFGFSSAATKIGLGGAEIGTVLKNLMARIGYDQFYIQAGDWGALIASMMTTLYPNKIKGYHTNFAISLSELSLATWFAGSADTSLVVDPSLESRLYPFLYQFRRTIAITGYLHMQATKPDTLGIAMTDSPISLLTYYLMLMSLAGLEPFTHEELLDNLMIYWIQNRFTTATRLYAEGFNLRNVREKIYAKPTSVPTRIVQTKNEIAFQSVKVLASKFTNIQNATALDRFGHFLAMEAPEVYSDLVVNAMTGFYNSEIRTCS